MYARSTTVMARPGHIEEGTSHINRNVLPVLETIPGFIGMSLMVDRESERCILTTSWDSSEAMHASEESVGPIRDAAAAIFSGPGPKPQSAVDHWQIVAMHRDHSAHQGTWVRSTWLKLETARFNQALDFCRTSVLPAIQEFEGFCSASVMTDPPSRRAVISASYDSAEALDLNRERARSLRTARLRELGADQLDVGEFELAIARLRVPEMA